MIRSVLFVCDGNTCRSPTAEALFRKAAVDQNIEVSVSSAGLHAGSETAPNARKAIEKYEASLAGHRPRNADPGIFAEADLILTMTKDHLARVPSEYRNKAFRLKDYAQVKGTKGGDVDDPWGSPLSRYEACAAEIHAAVLGVLRRLRNEGDVSEKGK